MRKLSFLLSLIVSAFFVVGCGPDTPDTPTPPAPEEAPVITLAEAEVDFDSFTFDVTTTIPGVLGYAVVAEGNSTPTMDEIFAANSQEVESSATITVSGLNDNTNYTLFAVLRAADTGVLSAPKSLKFTTPDDGEVNPIVVTNVGYDIIEFTINVEGSYVFQCIDKAYIEHMGQTPESYIQTPGIGIPAKGVMEVDWIDGSNYGAYDMNVREDSDYYIIVAITDGQTITDQIYITETHTPKRPHSEAGMTIELKDISSTEVTVTTTPDDSVTEYYVWVRSKAEIDYFIQVGGGETFLHSLIKNANAGSWHLTAANEGIWSGLEPSTLYNLIILVIDNKGAEALIIQEFTTLEPQLSAPTVEMSVTADSTAPHSVANVNVYSELAASGKLIFRPTADVEQRRAEYGYEDSQLIESFGTALTDEQVAAISTTGVSIAIDNLWPETEYTVMLSIKNAEKTETVKVTKYTTEAQPAAPRVESELFTSLLGEWTVSYELYQRNSVKTTISDVVTIAQGVDSKTETDYRNQNRLVVLGLPFNADAQGNYSEMPMYSPADLIAASNYYAKYPSLAYRDYGPKFFLEIGEGDVVTVPTSKNEYFYNWSDDGFFNFYGCDFDNLMTAPATFPVTVSADGNTITIGAHRSGEEFGYGVYRPAVFMNDSTMIMVAISDITLKRVN